MDRRISNFHAVPPPPLSMVKKHGSNDYQFVYKGVDLVDLEGVVGSAFEDGRFEVWQLCRVCWYAVCFFYISK